MTCLNICYKMFTDIGNYMKEHAERNNIWDKNQLGTLCTVHERKAYDMLRHEQSTRVYQWIEVP